jgi:hypothetical protein
VKLRLLAGHRAVVECAALDDRVPAAVAFDHERLIGARADRTHIRHFGVGSCIAELIFLSHSDPGEPFFRFLSPIPQFSWLALRPPINFPITKLLRSAADYEQQEGVQSNLIIASSYIGPGAML